MKNILIFANELLFFILIAKNLRMMRKQIPSIRVVFAVLLPAFLLTACTESDDDSVDFNTFILGKWSVYKAVVPENNKNIDVAVDKEGNFSQLYYEVALKDGDEAEVSCYKEDGNNENRWETRTYHYTVKDDAVTIHSETPIYEMIYSSHDNALYMKVPYYIVNYGSTTAYVFLRK